jgi:hypothetical protein
VVKKHTYVANQLLSGWGDDSCLDLKNGMHFGPRRVVFEQRFHEASPANRGSEYRYSFGFDKKCRIISRIVLSGLKLVKIPRLSFDVKVRDVDVPRPTP